MGVSANAKQALLWRVQEYRPVLTRGVCWMHFGVASCFALSTVLLFSCFYVFYFWCVSPSRYRVLFLFCLSVRISFCLLYHTYFILCLKYYNVACFLSFSLALVVPPSCLFFLFVIAILRRWTNHDWKHCPETIWCMTWCAPHLVTNICACVLYAIVSGDNLGGGGEQKEFGMPWKMRVVPLFETLDDLDKSEDTLR